MPSQLIFKVGKRINDRDLLKSGAKAYYASIVSSIAFRTQLLQDIQVPAKPSLEMTERSGIDTSSLRAQFDALVILLDNINMDHHSVISSDIEKTGPSGTP